MTDMVLVPRIATDAMMDAMFDTARQRERHMDGGVGYVQLRAAWEAALSAAPPASVGRQEARAKVELALVAYRRRMTTLDAAADAILAALAPTPPEGEG